MGTNRTVDLLEHWRDCSQITFSEYEAGRRLRKVFALTIKGGLDHRSVPPDASAEAARALKALLPILGEDRKHVTVAVLCRGFTANDALRAFGQLGIRSEDDVRLMVRNSLAAMSRHRWATARETPALDIPEVVSILTDAGLGTVKLQA